MDRIECLNHGLKCLRCGIDQEIKNTTLRKRVEELEAEHKVWGITFKDSQDMIVAAHAKVSELESLVAGLRELSSCQYCRRFGPSNKAGEHHLPNMGEEDQELWFCEAKATESRTEADATEKGGEE